MNRIVALLSLPLLATSAAMAQAEKKTEEKPKLTYARAGRLFDATSETVKQNMVIVIEGERIKQVAPAAQVQVPAGAEVIDLSQATVLPGLIDLHTHLSSRADTYDPINRFRLTPFHAAFAAVVNARKTLEAGFTTVQEVGGAPFVSVDLRNWINEGYLVGPRVIAAGPGISITGGHGDLNNYAPQVRYEMFPGSRDMGIADGVPAVRRAVRSQLRYDVDVIKILATGGVLSKGTRVGAPQFTEEELRAAAEEAHAAGRKITAHAHGAEGIKNAIRAGIDSIQHASLVDDEGIALARQHGTYFVMDIYNDDYLLGEAIKHGLPEENIEKEKMVGRTQRENFRKAFQAGVKMAFGSDAGVYPHGDNGKQFAKLVEWGMTPAQAIRAATFHAAEAADRSRDIGTLEAGKYADLIAVSADPLQEVRALENVQFVMKGGKVYKNTLGK